MMTPASDLLSQPDETSHFLAWLIGFGGYAPIKRLPDARWAAVKQMLFTYAIHVGRISDYDFVDDHWCYHSAEEAREALREWDGTGEPKGWHWHPYSGRRVAEDGTMFVRA